VITKKLLILSIVFGTVTILLSPSTLQACTYEGDIHFKPWSDPQSINLRKKGLVPIVIFSGTYVGSDGYELDVYAPEDVDLTPGIRLRVPGNPAVWIPVAVKGNKLKAHAEDYNDDGVLDLVAHVNVEDLVGVGFVEGANWVEIFVELYKPNIHIYGWDVVKIKL